VAEGLAAVRRLERGRLELWAGAPALSISMSVGPESGGEWTIRLENVLSDVELRAEAAPGGALSPELVDAPAPTERTWRADLPAGAEIALTLRPPDADLLDPWRFAVYADVQEAIDGVQDIYTKMNAHPGVRFALISGDLTSQGTVEELTRFQREMKTLNLPCYATLGNHELGTAPPPYHDYFGRGNYRFVFRGVQFTMLDSASATIDPMVYDWLEGWLAEGRGKLHVTTMHIPPLDPVGLRNGAFASRAEADKLLAMFAGAGVDLTVYGHLHTYYAFENAGIPAYISGGGGAIPERMDGIGRHFLAVDVIPPGTISQVAVVRVD
jgi:3',5'-cyclic AMP phosphodiesterase CpdA